VTPTQLRAFAEVVRLGSVKAAAAHLGVTEAAVSLHVAALRKELDDALFHRAACGLAFTPGGLRLAGRAVELLGLQDQTRREVRDAAAGRRVLRLATTSLFAEFAAPGLIELFSTRANDLSVEMSVVAVEHFAQLVTALGVDIAVGPAGRCSNESIREVPFLRYQVVPVASPRHPAAQRRLGADELATQTWLLGPSAAEATSATTHALRALRVPERCQRIYQSHAAALDEAKKGNGVALALGFRVARDVEDRQLALVDAPGSVVDGTWSAFALGADRLTPVARELWRFITTPRATQAMLAGSGAGVSHFRPSVHVTLWS
jgi:DNA-binding transcriptional LysR family regulator